MPKDICSYRTPISRRSTQYGAATLTLALALSGAVSAGQAHADPPQQGGIQQSEPPQQGGVGGPSDQPAPPQQGGISPAPTPPPAPAPQAAPQAPSYDPGPLGLPAAPSAPQSDHVSPDYYSAPNYTPQIKPNGAPPKVKRVTAGPDKLLIGSFEMPAKDVPNFPNKASTIDWANGWAAYAQQEIANHLVALGVPEDRAVRRAAATVTAAVASGAVGGTVSFTATTIGVGLFTVPIGAGIGAGTAAAVTGGNPMGIAAGAGLGALGGGAVAVGAGTLVAVPVTILSALGGGMLAYALGAGDPGDTIKRPKDGLPGPGKHRMPELPNPEGNQFELHLPKEAAQQVGLPAVDYVVNKAGDVNLTVGHTTIGWTGQQAQAPIKALGAAAPAVEKVINDTTRAVTDQASKAIDGLQVAWPQLEPKGKKATAR
ncbi:hypothetical protein ACFQNE_03035 [Gordonia phosphorivorans]|uniref:Insoluble domain protein n=1 Tax=Gordonia phosphorivorans TaxID=1056982 RepID=A0ABV6H3Y0_9ACTN